MQKTSYYHKMFGRTNMLKHFILTLFFSISSFPRLLLEVFIRKSFGRRYFSMMAAITITVILAAFPYIVFHNNPDFGIGTFIGKYVSWYAYLIIFMYFCIIREREIAREPGVFDFAKFSLYSGDRHPLFTKMDLLGIKNDQRTVATLLEPAAFLIIGIVLIVLQQPIGFVITFCSLCYSISYFGAYYLGDQFMMDVIDEIISSEELGNAIVEGREPQETRGFEMFTEMPTSHEFRQKVVDHLTGNEEILQAY